MRAFVKGTDIEITGTLEHCPGRCDIAEDGFYLNDDGTVGFDYGNNGTELFWDAQETVKRDGKRVFIDEDGGEHTEDEIELREEP